MRRTRLAATALLMTAVAVLAVAQPASASYRPAPTRPAPWNMPSDGGGYPGCCDPSNPDPGHHWGRPIVPTIGYRSQPVR